MATHRGWILLDIDGTVTDATHGVPQQVVEYLHHVKDSGWEVLFITGRPFSFAWDVIKKFDFPFYLALQNGADILWMPERRLVVRHYLGREIITLLERVCSKEQEDFLIYSGYAHGDFCYYRPSHFSSILQAHLKKLMHLSVEPWQAVTQFDFPLDFQFPLAKCLGAKEAIERLHQRLSQYVEINATMLRDPLTDGIYLNLITAPQATKGQAFQAVLKRVGIKGPVIAAGDDGNDESMLQEADVKIVMETAPLMMHAMADIIAKPGTECGIIAALEEAIASV